MREEIDGGRRGRKRFLLPQIAARTRRMIPKITPADAVQ